MLTYEQSASVRATGTGNAEDQEQTSARGRVFLVGAGPGDAELITVKGLRCLRAADVVVYDRLIDPTLLDEARPDAFRIYVGKGPRCHAMKQDGINGLLISQARQGRIVVRLKGGDPFVFGRGGEEALALSAASIPFEVVPGISSAVAVPAYAGIPVTHRGYASHVTIVTGHEAAREQGTRTGAEQQRADPVNWEALAAVGGTLVILMGVRGLPCIVRRLLDGGLDRETPAAVIQQGTTRQQRVVTGTIATIAQHAADAGLESPAITIIGAVAGLRDSLAWFEVAQLRTGAW